MMGGSSCLRPIREQGWRRGLRRGNKKSAEEREPFRRSFLAANAEGADQLGVTGLVLLLEIIKK